MSEKPKLPTISEEANSPPKLLVSATPMRRGLSKTFRSNLVEFDTNLGVRYATAPTFWVRIYLIWTFRNFRSLPKQVFNRRQQALIDKLIRSSTTFPGTRFDRSSLIGTVEQVRFTPSRISRGEIGRGPALAGNSVARGEDEGIVGSSRGPEATGAQATLRVKKPRESPISVPKLGTHNVTTDKMIASFLLLGTAMLIGVLLLRNGHIHILGNQVSSSRTTLSQTESSQAHMERVVVVASSVRTTEPLSHTTDKPQALASGQLPASSKPDASRQSLVAGGSLDSLSLNPGPLSLASVLSATNLPSLAEPASPKPATSEMDRTLPRLVGPPQSHMVYPTHPDTEQNGKVVLTAVVGQDGTVKSITVISGQTIFVNAAIKAVKQWRYLPYEHEGTPVEFQTTIGFDFRGDEVVSVSFPQL